MERMQLLAPSLVEIALRGRLTARDLSAALEPAERALRERTDAIVMLVDCSAMTDYDTAAREAFVAWNKANRKRVAKLAVVTTKPLWHLVVSAMALASGQNMRAFSDRPSASAWLEG